MPATLSGSGIARAIACPAAYALPAVGSVASTDAARGSEVHAFLERIVDGESADVALEQVSDPAARALCRLIDLRHVPVGAESEVAFAYDPATGRARRTKTEQHREYAVGEHEIPGTCDVVHGDLVLDWKTSRWDFDVESARPQLEFYALCLARSAGLATVRYRIAVISDDGAVGGPPEVTLDWEDLARIAARVRRAWERVQAARAAADVTPDVAEGPHCRWCPAAVHCPAKRAAVAAVLGGDPSTLTPADVGRALVVARDAIAAAERVKEVAKGLLEHLGLDELPAGNGQAVRRDGRGALRIVRAA